MHQLQKSFFTLIVFLLPVLLWQMISCKKEHSCEGCLAPPSAPPPDTIVISSPPATDILPGCSLCVPADDPLENTWSFTTGNTYVCGGISDCGFIGGHTTFTFFGPSPCSSDTGLVMTVYLPVSFDNDQSNITTTDAAFYYYDNLASKDILIREPATPFTVTIQHFNSATGLTTGTFQGTVFTADGSTALVENGKFKIILK